MGEFEDLRGRLAEREQAAADARDAARAARVELAATGGERAKEKSEAADRTAAAAAREHAQALEEFLAFSDPRKNVSKLPDDWPILLMPVRLETRFGVGKDEAGRERPELWVRLYPDDCSVSAFDPVLSTGEVTAAIRFWRESWRAAGSDAGSRAAWRNLAGGYGVGRARWIIEAFAPVNPGDRPGVDPGRDLVLVVSTDQLPPQQLRDQLSAHWVSVWKADGDQPALAAAWSSLVSDLGGEAAARDAVGRYQPFNLADAAAPDQPRQSAVVEVAWLQLPAATGEDRLGWRSAPTARALPEQFVLTLFPTGGQPFEAIGKPVAEPLYVGPDPLGDPIVPLNGKLTIPQQLAWMFDFKAAEDAGVGIRVPLTEAQAAAGFDRIVALGVRMRSDAEDGRRELERLLAAHTHGRTGFELLPQGAATNNTDGTATPWSRRDDPDLAYDDVLGPATFVVTGDPLEKRDGQVFAERLGLDPAALHHVRGADNRDAAEALAINTALAPGTLNYLTGTMLSPVFGQWEGEIAWYFTSYVTGRGAVPAVRIGSQPYGVIASTALSRIGWLDERPAMVELPRVHGPFLRRLHGVLRALEQQWRAQLGEVHRVGSGADAHQTLLGALGLHPGSAEFHIRYGKHVDDLVSRGGFLFLNILVLVLADQQRQRALDLLRSFGYSGPDPQLLDLFFTSRPHPLVGPLIEAGVLSETTGLSDSTTDGRNYLEWLADTASVSLDSLRAQQGFVGNAPPKALLYIMAQFALVRGYLDASDRLRVFSGLWAAETALQLRREPTSVNLREQPSASDESPWRRLYDTDVQLTGSPGQTVADHLTAVLPDPPEYAVDLADQIRALQHLRDTPTARLERLLVEHIDTLTYRYDAWRLGLVTWQLDQMRAKKERGLYLGSYGWLEDVQRKPTPRPGPTLEGELAATFAGDAPLRVDPTNGGHLHAPSMNQAVTAAILRAGELANRPAAPGAFSVNLSSERIRQATALLEGVRTGQGLGALLGYRFERALHDLGGIVELDALVFTFRRAFPLTANKLTDTQAPEEATEALEARNVTDGLALVKKAGPEPQYPYGADLPPLSVAHRTAVNQVVREVSGVFDALADLVLAEGVHQSAQNNPERSGAHIDIQGDFTAPPEAEVVRTPTRGFALTSRVGLELDPTAVAGPGATPRAHAQPAVDAWLARALPPMADIGCQAVWQVPGQAEQSRFVTLADLGLRPLDALELISDHGGADLGELEARVRRHVLAVDNPRADAVFHLRHMEADAGRTSVFVASAMTTRLRGLVLQSRPLRAGDVMPPSQGDSANSVPHVIDPSRLTTVITALTTLRDDLDAAISAGDTALANRAAMLTGIDAQITTVADLAARVALFGGARTGWGAQYEWRADLFSALISRTSELLDRWQQRLDAAGEALAAELEPGLGDEARVALLRAAEGQVSTALAPELDPLSLRPKVEAAVSAFEAKRNAIRATVIDAADPSLADRLTRCASVLPLSAFDPQTFDYDDLADRVVAYWSQLQAILRTLRSDVDERALAAQAAVDESAAALDPQARLLSLQRAAEKVFGEGFRLVPGFTLPATLGADLTQAHQHFTSGGLLTEATSAIGVDNPLDTWLYGIARVRGKMRFLEDLVMLWDAHQLDAGELAVSQLPHEAAAPWLALDFPDSYVPDGERMSYVALVGAGYDPTAERCGLLVDEWSETIPALEPDEPGPQHTSGVAFHFDRPSQEPPQAMLLLTPATWDGAWSWDELLHGVVDTFDLARLRAVEPDQLADTSLTQFLPATIAAVTTTGLLLTANYALANTDVIVKRTPDG
jgi:hypothetical protein